MKEIKIIYNEESYHWINKQNGNFIMMFTDGLLLILTNV